MKKNVWNQLICIFIGIKLVNCRNESENSELEVIIDLREDSTTKQIEWQGYRGQRASGCYFEGNDFQLSLTSSSECINLCDRSPQCTHFSWNTQNSGTCFLKKGSVSRKDAVKIDNEQFQCGFSYFQRKLEICGARHSHEPLFKLCDMSEIRWITGDYAYGCRFLDEYFRSFTSTDRDCVDECYKTPNCSHFTWSPLDGGVCFLHAGKVAPSDAYKTNDLGYLCGIGGLLDPISCEMAKNRDRVKRPMTPASIYTCKRIDVFDIHASSWGSPSLKIFSELSFNIGIDFWQVKSNSINNYNYITMWINSVDKPFGAYDDRHFISMLKKCKQYDKIPVLYAYVIAFEARSKQGLQDCDVVLYDENLCTNGSCFIREYRDHLVRVYGSHAKEVSTYLGRYSKAVFLIEPDFWQYYGDSRQKCRMSGPEMRDLFRDFVKAIKNQLPNAEISWDISSWLTPLEFCEWWKFFEKCDDCEIDYIHTSGGQSVPELSRIKPHQLEWSFVSELTGKPIIADCGYGVAGMASDNCLNWMKKSNLVARKADGVVALSIANPIRISRPKTND